MMNRRYFLKLSVASSSWALLGACEAGTKGLVEPASGDTGVSAHDGAVLYQDAGTAAQDAGTAALDAGTAALDAGLLDAGEADAGLGPPFSIRESFTVILNDSTCSKHTHTAFVEAGTYAEDREVHFLGGSHALVFRVSELLRLERGERIPFSTVGPGPNHGHCGTAWRSEVGPPEPDRPDQCVVRGTAMCLA